MEKTIIEKLNKVLNLKMRSKWDNAVNEYALELLEDLESNPSLIEEFNDGMPIREKDLLNGACDWQSYSEGGCSFIYDEDIAERVCTPSELKRSKNGERNPNRRESWIDVQARALRQASRRILYYAKHFQGGTMDVA